MNGLTMPSLREAIEASWGVDTAYLQASEEGNAALGNCYPTSRVVQHFFPEMDIVEGQVWTGTSTERHFWNVMVAAGSECHVDLTWQQFPHGSAVRQYQIRDGVGSEDSEATTRRVELLLGRVLAFLEARRTHGF